MKSISYRLLKTTMLTALGVLALNMLELQARTEADVKRDETSKPEQILEFAGVKAGEQILDFLGGGGYYSEILSKAVGAQGKVVLQNNQAYIPFVGKDLEERLADNRLGNVEKLMSEVEDLKLGDNRFDIVFFVLGYHDLYVSDKNWRMPADEVIPQIAKSMKPHGRLLIIDHNAAQGSGSGAAQSLHRIDSKFVVADLARLGFKLVKSSDLLSNPNDNLTINVFDPSIRRKTDRFVMLFEKQ